jgi:hypothetical protein
VSTDRELLKDAAKAAGIEIKWMTVVHTGEEFSAGWNPLTVDGDALRLAVKLNIRFAGEWRGHCVALVGIQEFTEQSGGDPISATRRAITRAAAEIGKAMP